MRPMNSTAAAVVPDMEAKNLADLYDLPTLEWEPIETALAAGYTQAPDTGGPNRHSTWIATIDADGSPNVNGIGSMWVDGAFIFETGRTSRKGRNLERDPRCTLSLALHDFDLVVEGEAELVTDPAVVADVARRYAEHGWPAARRRERDRAQRRIQRALCGTAAVARLPRCAEVGHGRQYGRARRRDAVDVLSRLSTFRSGPLGTLAFADGDRDQSRLRRKRCPNQRAVQPLHIVG